MSTTLTLGPAIARRWWTLATVVAAQFMFVVDAFIVNVAIPAIRADLHASGGEIEAVIAIYQIAFATIVITGGRLGDIHGRRRLFLIGLLGFTATSVWCGLAGSATELILARLAQGATAALMSPQVLATIHTLFPDAARARAFAIFGIALGLGGATGFLLGGWLVTWDIAGLGWRLVFFVNGPVGLAIAIAAIRLMPPGPARPDMRLDMPGAAVLFLGLIFLVGPVLCARELGWAWWLWLIEAAGLAVLAGFLRLERRVLRRGGAPLIDLALLQDRAFLRGLGATACFFGANISFYLVVTLYLQAGLGFDPFRAGLTVLPLAIAFVIASRRGSAAASRDGVGTLIRGCFVQGAGLAATFLLIALRPEAGMASLALPLAIVGYGQGLVMAPLFGTVLTSVRHSHAGAGSGVLTTVQQIANGAGVALVGAAYFSVEAAASAQAAMLVSLAILAAAVLVTAALLAWMRRAGR